MEKNRRDSQIIVGFLFFRIFLEKAVVLQIPEAVRLTCTTVNCGKGEQGGYQQLHCFINLDKGGFPLQNETQSGIFFRGIRLAIDDDRGFAFLRMDQALTAECIQNIPGRAPPHMIGLAQPAKGGKRAAVLTAAGKNLLF